MSQPDTAKVGLFARLGQWRRARLLRAAERARVRREEKVAGSATGHGPKPGVGGGLKGGN
jgi:hypothetical protein